MPFRFSPLQSTSRSPFLLCEQSPLIALRDLELLYRPFHRRSLIRGFDRSKVLRGHTTKPVNVPGDFLCVLDHHCTYSFSQFPEPVFQGK
jgi:hypothetical protein